MGPRTKFTIATLAVLAVAVTCHWLTNDASVPAGPAAAPGGTSTATPRNAVVPEPAVVERADVTPTPPVSPPTQASSLGTAPGSLTTETMSVKDLVFPRGTEAPFYESMDALVANLKEASDPKYWREEGAIVGEDSGYLTVQASAAMQRQVAQVLADARMFSTARGRRR